MGWIYKGEQARDLERYYGLMNEIKYFELERVNNDIRNTYKNKELYRLFWALSDDLRKKGLI